MASNYTGNPSATQPPAPKPGPGQIPIVSIPAGTDAPTIESITQLIKCNTDYNAWSQQPNLATIFRENWYIAAPNTLSATTLQIADLQKRWDYTLGAVDATQTANWQDPMSSYGARSVLLNQGTANVSHSQNLSTHYPITKTFSGQVLCMDFDVQATSSTLNSREWHLGIGGGPSVSAVLMGFYTDYTGANWKYGNAETWVDSGVPVNIGGAFDRMRLIMDTTLSTPQVTYFINGTLVGTVTTSLPAAGTALYPTFVGRQVVSGVCSYTLGEVLVWAGKF